MKIVNPLYDLAFKYLMENERLAKKVISVLLDTEVEELSIGQQETILPISKRGLSLFRLDFTAIIKLPDGTSKKVLIELQKSKNPVDIQRFRTYLGSNYLSKKDDENEEEKAMYPIITIYLLGYNMDDLPYLAVKVNREVIDSSNNKTVIVNSYFVEHLTHQSHIIQVRRLPEKRQTRLEKFLTLFNQSWISEQNYILDLQDVPEEFVDMAKYLQGPLMDDKFRRQLDAEEEVDNRFDKQEAKYLKKFDKLKQSEKEAKQREKVAKQREKKAKQREEEYKQREKESKKREEESKKREKELAIKFAYRLKKLGSSIEEISNETGLPIEEIKKL